MIDLDLPLTRHNAALRRHCSSLSISIESTSIIVVR